MYLKPALGIFHCCAFKFDYFIVNNTSDLKPILIILDQVEITTVFSTGSHGWCIKIFKLCYFHLTISVKPTIYISYYTNRDEISTSQTPIYSFHGYQQNLWCQDEYENLNFLGTKSPTIWNEFTGNESVNGKFSVLKQQSYFVKCYLMNWVA